MHLQVQLTQVSHLLLQTQPRVQTLVAPVAFWQVMAQAFAILRLDHSHLKLQL